MTAQRPDQFAKTVAQTRTRIGVELDRLVAQYEVAHGASHWQVVRENAGKVMSGGPTDPTATITGDPLDRLHPGAQAAIRKQLENARKRVEEVPNIVHGIEKDIARAMDRLDPRVGFEPTRYPITASQDNLAEAHEAQRRRIARGET